MECDIHNFCGKVKHEQRVGVTSSDIQVTSLNLRVTSSNTQSTSSNLPLTSSNLQVTSSNPRVMSANLPVTSSNPRNNMSSNLRVRELKARVKQ